MKTVTRVCVLVAIAVCAVHSRAAGQSASIEFVARTTPSSGVEEPVRGFPFYLLIKGFADIEKEADASVPKPDMQAFIDKLDSPLSSELKAWMKKREWVNLSGEEFTQKLTPDDILTVPEFRRAYLERNAGDQSTDFPKLKAKASDKTKNPEKFDKLSADYTQAIRHYIDQHPGSTAGMELSLTDINPGPKWNELTAKRGPEVRRRALEWAQSRYLVARTQTDLLGQGFLRGIAPGNYWISTLDVAAVTGDVRSRWDVPVTLRPGQTEYVTLSNVNSIHPAPLSP
jgi:hypothetical protein